MAPIALEMPNYTWCMGCESLMILSTSDGELHIVPILIISLTIYALSLSVGPEPLPKGSRFQDKFVGYKNFLDNYAEFCEQTIPREFIQSTL